jgi:hypothetical protein
VRVRHLAIKEVIQLPEDEKLHAIAYLSDETVLHIRERFHKKLLIKYSYHHITDSGIYRWDNVPHHSSVLTFPYHCHIQDEVKESVPMDIIKVFQKIESE